MFPKSSSACKPGPAAQPAWGDARLRFRSPESQVSSPKSQVGKLRHSFQCRVAFDRSEKADAAAQSIRRGRTGLPELPRPDATHRMDYAAPRHHHSPGMANRTASATPMAAPKGRGHRRCPSQGHPRLRRGDATAAAASLKNPKNSKRDPTPIIAGRVSFAFSLTRAVAGRINKQELLYANTLSTQCLSHFRPPPRIKTRGPSTRANEMGLLKSLYLRFLTRKF